jgi:hypothetical protein
MPIVAPNDKPDRPYGEFTVTATIHSADSAGGKFYQRFFPEPTENLEQFSTKLDYEID